MRMPYTSNPNFPQVRSEAVRLVQEGQSVRSVARHFGFAHNTVLNWLKRQPEYGPGGKLVIATRSSRPHTHPRALPREIVDRILALRAERRQCAQILHWRLGTEGVSVSLASVKRVLKRAGVSRYSKWKKWHTYPERPMPEKPGYLVQIDTVHDGPPEGRVYLYTLLDVCSRWAHASAVPAISVPRSAAFLRQAREEAPFPFVTVQSDHGSEFSRRLTVLLGARGISHRHSRVRTPTDNGHLERFNRTIQEECLARVPRSLRAYRRAIPEWLHYYNTERPHMGLNMATPTEVVRRY
jgi:transposase InsO family protein